jgi:hypothetical protein
MPIEVQHNLGTLLGALWLAQRAGRAQQGIGNVSTDHLAGSRRPSAAISGHGFGALCLFAAVMLLPGTSVAYAVEAQSRPSLEKNNFYLSSAGFRIQVANDQGRKDRMATPFATGFSPVWIRTFGKRPACPITSGVPGLVMAAPARQT